LVNLAGLTMYNEQAMEKKGVMSQQQADQQFSYENNTQYTLAEEIYEEKLSTVTGGVILVPGAAGLGDMIGDAAIARRLAGRRLTRTCSAPARLDSAPFSRMPASPSSSRSSSSGVSSFEDGQGSSPVHPI
jgi:hypothetical protein